MLCLNNIQKALSTLTHSKNTLPEIKELLSAQGYTGIQKGDEFIDLRTKVTKAVDTYAQSAEFKELSTDKQSAILALRTFTPEPMPEGLTIKDFENLKAHFENKADKTQREAYLKLFEITKNKPNIILEVLKNGELRQEYQGF